MGDAWDEERTRYQAAIKNLARERNDARRDLKVLQRNLPEGSENLLEAMNGYMLALKKVRDQNRKQNLIIKRLQRDVARRLIVAEGYLRQIVNSGGIETLAHKIAYEMVMERKQELAVIASMMESSPQSASHRGVDSYRKVI